MKQKLLLTIAISILSIFAAQATYGQIQINIPWGKKKEKKAEVKPTPTPTSETTKIEPTNNSATPKVETPVVQDNPLGKIYFSNKPFPAGGGTEGSKTSFTSNEFIYGRLVLNGGTVKDVMKPTPATDNTKSYNLSFAFYKVYKSSTEGVGPSNNVITQFNAIVLESDLDKTYWDFDFFPEPNRAKALIYGSRDFLKGSLIVYEFLRKESTEEGTYNLGVEIQVNETDFRGQLIPAYLRKTIGNDISFTFRGLSTRQ